MSKPRRIVVRKVEYFDKNTKNIKTLDTNFAFGNGHNRRMLGELAPYTFDSPYSFEKRVLWLAEHSDKKPYDFNKHSIENASIIYSSQELVPTKLFISFDNSKMIYEVQLQYDAIIEDEINISVADVLLRLYEHHLDIKKDRKIINSIGKSLIDPSYRKCMEYYGLDSNISYSLVDIILSNGISIAKSKPLISRENWEKFDKLIFSMTPSGMRSTGVIWLKKPNMKNIILGKSIDIPASYIEYNKEIQNIGKVLIQFETGPVYSIEVDSSKDKGQGIDIENDILNLYIINKKENISEEINITNIEFTITSKITNALKFTETFKHQDMLRLKDVINSILQIDSALNYSYDECDKPIQKNVMAINIEFEKNKHMFINVWTIVPYKILSYELESIKLTYNNTEICITKDQDPDIPIFDHTIDINNIPTFQLKYDNIKKYI